MTLLTSIDLIMAELSSLIGFWVTGIYLFWGGGGGGGLTITSGQMGELTVGHNIWEGLASGRD